MAWNDSPPGLYNDINTLTGNSNMPYYVQSVGIMNVYPQVSSLVEGPESVLSDREWLDREIEEVCW